jgi:hypothetical protein
MVIPLEKRVSVGKISAMQGLEASSPDIAAPGTLPIPVTSIAIGEPAGNEGYLGIAVGQAELVFAVPMAAFDSLGRTMLMVSAQPNPQYKTRIAPPPAPDPARPEIQAGDFSGRTSRPIARNSPPAADRACDSIER